MFDIQQYHWKHNSLVPPSALARLEDRLLLPHRSFTSISSPDRPAGPSSRPQSEPHRLATATLSFLFVNPISQDSEFFGPPPSRLNPTLLRLSRRGHL